MPSAILVLMARSIRAQSPLAFSYGPIFEEQNSSLELGYPRWHLDCFSDHPEKLHCEKRSIAAQLIRDEKKGKCDR